MNYRPPAHMNSCKKQEAREERNCALATQIVQADDDYDIPATQSGGHVLCQPTRDLTTDMWFVKPQKALRRPMCFANPRTIKQLPQPTPNPNTINVQSAT